MRNLLYQFKRAVGHMKSILSKLMSKMMKGASFSAKVILSALTLLAIVPVAVLSLGLVVVYLMIDGALGGAPVPIDSTPTHFIPVEVSNG